PVAAASSAASRTSSDLCSIKLGRRSRSRESRGVLVRYSYATHLECSVGHDRYDIRKLQGLSAAGKPLLARYDLEALRREVRREEIARRPRTYCACTSCCRPRIPRGS